jgi:Flp pilus assembly protein TadG
MGLTSATSTVFAITHAAASELAFTTQPGSATVGQPLSTQPIVTIRDEFGNTVLSSSASVTVGLVGEGALLGTLTKSASSGVANFSTNALTVAGSVGSRQLTADASGLSTVTSSAFTVRGMISAIDPDLLYQTGGVTTTPVC